jgi:hypothetical protein
MEVPKSSPPQYDEGPAPPRVRTSAGLATSIKVGQQRRNFNRGALGIALGAGTLVGAMIAAVALSSREPAPVTPPIATSGPVAAAQPAPSPVPEPVKATPSSAPPPAVSAEPAPARASAAKATVKAPATGATAAKRVNKAKKSHDFGF